MVSKLDRLYEDLDDAIQEKDWEFSLSLCNKILRLEKDDDVTWNTKGVVLMKMGDYEEALKSFQKAIEISPKVADIWYSKGAALLKLKRYPEAMDSFNNALKINPSMNKAYERYKDTLELYKKVMREGPGGVFEEDEGWGETPSEEGGGFEEEGTFGEEGGFEEEGVFEEEEEPFEEEEVKEEVKPVVITCINCGKKFKITNPKRPLKFRCPYCGQSGMLVKKK